MPGLLGNFITNSITNKIKKSFKLGQAKTWLVALLVCSLLIPLLCFPLPVFGATDLTEADFSESLLKALNTKLEAPLTFPISSDDAVFRITSLDLSNQGINNLKGIEHFANLSRLTLDYNKLTSLASAKFPNKIRYLSISNNALSRVDEGHWPTQLIELNLRNNRLSSPLGIGLPSSTTLLQLDNNFLTSKIYAPSNRKITYNGNFIYEAGKIKPANLQIVDTNSITLYPGDQKAIPFVDVVTTTNPNNSLPANLYTGKLEQNSGVVRLSRQEYRFLLQANQAGTDSLILELNFSDYMLKQYNSMNLTFHQLSVPITVWQSAADRTEARVKNNGDTAIIRALEGRSNHAVADATMFSKGQVSFSPGLLLQLAQKNKKLILTHDFGSLTLDSNLLESLAKQASINVNASIVLTLENHEQRPFGYGPSRFSQKEISSLPYPDFTFTAQLQIPKKGLSNLQITSPVSVTLYLNNQDFSTWDFNHLTAFKDDLTVIHPLGGLFSQNNGYFTYQIDSAGRYGLGTRGRMIKWLDLAINSATLKLSDDTTLKLSPTPLLYQGVTMVPARAIFESMGASVRWNDYSKMTIISYGNKTFYVQANNKIAGTDLQPYLLNGRMLVPLRYLSSEIGASVLWWSDGGKIRIVY